MSNLTVHSAQEVSALYGQLSLAKQNELFLHLRQMVEQERFHKENNTANDDLLSLAGSMKTDIKLSDDELDEAIRSSYYARDEQ